ncbi:hypothetical protein TrVFT333_002437 [Trichoderma virens FT-333]|nr:hypothetical protein TrVFT333_002437 [Trichoderma virens FT-333]
MDDPIQPTASGRPRKRAVEACIFCRKRKIKCNNEQPVCANCRTYGKDCIYEPLSESSQLPAPGRLRAQPSHHSKAAQRRLRSRVPRNDEPAVVSPAGLEQDPACPNPTFPAHQDRPQSREGLVSPGVSRLVVSANGVSSYHGRTSALFDENLPDRLPGEFRPRMPDEWVEKGLVAEAAKQRQLEELNFRAGKLDFDTVDPDLGMHLLSLHWNRQHHSFLITYRPAFMRDMACGGPYFSKLLLNAIYFGAAKFSPRLEVRKDPDDPRTAGWKFRQRVRELLGGSLDRSDITTIQALLVMTNSLFALGDERNAAWLYSGLAFRMIIDLGIHVDITDRSDTRRLSDEDIEIRRRVFWGAFVVDKIQSLYQGRPATLRELDALVPIKFFDTFEEFEFWEPAMYYVLIILLHRPFVADGHLHNMSRSISVNSFIECASAASNIVSLLRAYDQAFSVRRAPYLISYATYVAATIHTRIAAKRAHASKEHRNLETCLAVFRENQATNWAVRRANLVIRNLMKRLGVSIDEGEEGLRIHVDREAGPALLMVGNSWLNIDEIMQSFVREGEQCGQKNSVVQPMVQQDDLSSVQRGSASLQTPKSIQYGPEIMHSQPRDHISRQDGETQAATWHHPGTDDIVGTSSVDDLLFGFNGSALDSFQFLEWESM